MLRLRHVFTLLFTAASLLTLQAAVAAPTDVPAGFELHQSFAASGVQIYECKAEMANSYKWVFKAPLARLFDRQGNLVAVHYDGPVWLSNKDGSKIQGARLASEPATGPRSIPWLLLSAKVLVDGETFGGVDLIRRHATQGGAEPEMRCESSIADRQESVPYSAVYDFYKKKK